MPFSENIVGYINSILQKSSLNKKRLQPASFHGLCTTIAKTEGDNTAFMPGIIEGNNIKILTGNDKYALQLYHKIVSKSYGVERASFGDEFQYKSVADIQMIVYNNRKITGLSKYVLEPVIIFGIPQRLSPELKNELGLTNCTISAIGSSFDSASLFKQEFPGAAYHLNQNIELLQVRYRVETIFSTKCVDACLCD